MRYALTKMYAPEENKGCWVNCGLESPVWAAAPARPEPRRRLSLSTCRFSAAAFRRAGIRDLGACDSERSWLRPQPLKVFATASCQDRSVSGSTSPFSAGARWDSGPGHLRRAPRVFFWPPIVWRDVPAGVERGVWTARRSTAWPILVRASRNPGRRLEAKLHLKLGEPHKDEGRPPISFLHRSILVWMVSIE